MAETEGCGARPPSDRNTQWAQQALECQRLREEVARLAPAKDHLEAQLADRERSDQILMEMLRRERKERQRVEVLLAAALGELALRREGKVPEPRTPAGAEDGTRRTLPAMGRVPAPEDIPLPPKPPATEPAPTPSGPLDDCSAAGTWLLERITGLGEIPSRQDANFYLASRSLPTLGRHSYLGMVHRILEALRS